jgi:hypothetical protein
VSPADAAVGDDRCEAAVLHAFSTTTNARSTRSMRGRSSSGDGTPVEALIYVRLRRSDRKPWLPASGASALGVELGAKQDREVC